jgi:hypothetical protein
MDPVVTVDSPSVAVAIGGVAKVSVRVRNLNTTVESFRLDVLGDAARWAQLVPTQLVVHPQQEGLADLYFSPPTTAAAPSAPVPFGVRAVSTADPDTSAVAEGDLVIGAGVGQAGPSPGPATPAPVPGAALAGSAATAVTARITPTESVGRWSATHRIEFPNWGGGPLHVSLDASDLQDALRLDVTPSDFEVPVGTTTTARVKVRPRKRFLLGRAERHPFRVLVRPAQTSLEATFEQRGLLGGASLLVVLAGVLAAGALVWWFGLREDDGGGAAGAPGVPEAFAAEAVSHDAIRLTWEAGEDVDGYTVFEIDPADEDQADAVAFQEFDDIAGDDETFEVTELSAGTRYCFQLAARRGDDESDRTGASCADTLELGSAGPPTNVAVDEVESQQAMVTWVDGSQGLAEHLVWRNGQLATTVPAGTAEARVTLVEGENCFQVQSRIEEATSELSAEACLTGSGPPGEDLGVIAVARSILIEDVGAEQRANDFRDQLRAAGHEADVLNTIDYPALGLTGGNFFWVYIGGFADAEAASAYCQAAQLQCFTAEPGPPSS